MSELRGTFLLRCWRLGRGEERYALEHIQSGDRTVVASLPIASAWIEAHFSAASSGGPEDVGGGGAAPQTEARRGRGGHAVGERGNRGRAPPRRYIGSWTTARPERQPFRRRAGRRLSWLPMQSAGGSAIWHGSRASMDT